MEYYPLSAIVQIGDLFMWFCNLVIKGWPGIRSNILWRYKVFSFIHYNKLMPLAFKLYCNHGARIAIYT